jgi:2-polyprenyl-3-methyl-5-hydroxy-6-metoxy-1,4-benzoquinol methylase
MSEYIDSGHDNENESHAHRYLSRPLVNFLEKTTDPVILDLGCGNGSLAKALIEKGYNVYGTDASSKGIDIAQRHHPDRFAVQNLESDNLPNQLSQIKFNTIISTEVIEHLYNPRKFIRFSKAVLLQNGGGVLIISTPYHGYLKNLLLSLSGKWDDHINPLWDGGHIKMWSRNTITKLLEEEGFHITHFKGCGRVPYIWKSMMIKASLKVE